ncbi:MAG TPA: hypothetical protein ENN13_04660 [Candidatus Altiarchaeales archaeon]|nr:hypothetical protein [Candidatus Altiarchaeales archaeon]
MRNCGRCGRPIYNPGDALCSNCKKVIKKDHARHIEKENKKQDILESMVDSMANRGKEEDDDKYDLDFWGLEKEHENYQKKGKK